MPTRLVPALVVVLFLVAPLASVPVGATTTESPATATTAPAGTATAAQANDSAALPSGVGAVVDTATAPDGGAYLVGSSDLRDGNLTLTRLAANGSVVWQRQFTDPDAALGGRAVLSTETGVYVLAQAGPTDRHQRARTPPTVRMVRLTHDGTVQWRQPLGNASRIRPPGELVAATDDGVVYARPVRGDPPSTELIRITADGTVASTRTYTGGVPRAVAVAPNGDTLVAGERRFGEAWFLRVTAEGNVAVNRSFGDRRDRRIAAVVPIDGGGALLAGSARIDYARDDPWVMRVNAAGVPTWSHTYPAERGFPRAAVPTDAGVLLIHATRPEDGPDRTRLTHVATDGTVGTRTLNTSGRTTTARMPADDTVRVYGFDVDRDSGAITGTVAASVVPGHPEQPAPARAVTAVTSNTTVYRGQNLQFDASANVTYELYRLPDEYTDFDRPQLVRQVTPETTGPVTIETATLPSGQYAVRMDGSYWVVFDDGARADIATGTSVAAVTVEEQYLRVARTGADRSRRGPRFTRPGPNRTVVETFRGERGVRVRIRSDRTAFTARVGLSRLHAADPDRETLRAALAADPQFERVVPGWPPAAAPYGAVTMPADGDRNVTLDAGALPPGLYQLSVTPADAADATDPATTRLVVVTEDRPVTLTPGNDSLTVPRDGGATTNMTLAGLDAGLSALRLEANRTGDPPVRLRLGFTDAIDVGSASAGAGIGPDRSSAEVQSDDIERAPNGTASIARLSVRADRVRVAEPTTGTNTVTLRLAYVIDEAGIPYRLPEPVTIRYRVTNETTTNAGGSDGADRETAGADGAG